MRTSRTGNSRCFPRGSLAPFALLLLVACGDTRPIASSFTAQTPEDEAVTGSLPALDPLGRPISFSAVGTPSHGTLEIDSASGAFIYRPDRYFNGTDSFVFTAATHSETSSPATVTVVVTPVNDAPQAESVAAIAGASRTPAGALELSEDGFVTGRLQATDVDLDVVRFEIVALPSNGAMDLDPATGIFTYRPLPDWNGTDTFQFVAFDGFLYSAPVTVTLVVVPVNDPPVALDAAIVLDEDTVYDGRLVATDVDNTFLVYALVDPPAHGTVTVDPASGAFTYHPDPDYDGSDAFSFVASDGEASSAPATVSITVTPVNDPPVARDQAVVTDEDTPFSGVLVASDVDSPVLTYAIADPPAHGTVTLDGASGAFTYQPARDYNGPDGFTFVAIDGEASSAPSTISITINPVNDPPVAQDQVLQLDEDSTLAGVLVATDVDSPTLTYALILPPHHGKISLDRASGAFVYRPEPRFAGPDWFAFVASDGQALSRPGKVSITVRPINNVPIAEDQILTVGAGGTIVGRIDATDADNDSLSYQLASLPTSGTLDFDPATNLFTYTPAPGYVGNDAFQFTASDGSSTSAPGTVSISVTGIAPAGPRIIGQSRRTTATLGGTAALSLAVTGTAPFRFQWWKNGQPVAQTDSPLYVTDPLTRADNGACFAVTVYDQHSGITSLSWTLTVFEMEDDHEIQTLFSNQAELFPRRQSLSIKSITPSPTGIGATIVFDSSDGAMLGIDSAGPGTVLFDPMANSVTVAYDDPGVPTEQATQLTLSSLGDNGAPSSFTLGLTFSNSEWWAQAGIDRPSTVAVRETTVPQATSRVSDWVIASEEPTSDDITFAQATWGAAVSAFTTPTARAQALARAIIDGLEGHRGVPSDAMNQSRPFAQYQMAVSGLGQVWCSNIAAIFTLAARSFGIPARIFAMGRYQSLGATYDVLVADGHASTEIFDDQANQWVWIDATLYLLGAHGGDGSLLNAAELIDSWNGPDRATGALEVLEYDPATGLQTTVPASQSRQAPSLRQYAKRATVLSYRRNGSLYRELQRNRDEVYGGAQPIALTSVDRIPGAYGVFAKVQSSLPGFVRFRFRETYSSDRKLDSVTHESTDGVIPIQFDSPHDPVGKAKCFAVRAVDDLGNSSPEYVFTVQFYSVEFYASYGLTATGVVIFDDGDMPNSAKPLGTWVVEWPTFQDVDFATARWGAMLAPVNGPLAQARAIAVSLLASVSPHFGVAADSAEASPLDVLQRAEAGLQYVDSQGLARIFSRACNSLGIPARVVDMETVVWDGGGYKLYGAEPHGAVEVFDAATNRWIWFDLYWGVLGVKREGYGFLTAFEVKEMVSRGEVVGLTAAAPDGVGGLTDGIAWSDLPQRAQVEAYFRTSPTLRYRRAKTVQE
jgi:cadherin-like protein/Big-like domain-containing protein/transglutaminase superfamily protein